VLALALSAGAAPPRISIGTAGFPISATPAFGSLWVNSHRGSTLYRIDPAANRVARRLELPEDMCWTPTAAGGSLWVANCEGEAGLARVYRIDPRRNRITGEVEGGAPGAGDGSLWTVDDTSTVRRIDPRSAVVLVRLHVPSLRPFGPNSDPYIGGVRYGSVWVGGCTKVVRISVATNRVQAVVNLPASPGCPVGNLGIGYFGADRMAFVDGRVYLAAPNHLYEIDPRTNMVRRLPVRARPHEQWGDDTVLWAAGSLWLRVADTIVARIDPRTLRIVATYPAAGGGGGIAVAFGSLWVVNAGDDAVWREPL
jgi:glutamine cyclotransferase